MSVELCLRQQEIPTVITSIVGNGIVPAALLSIFEAALGRPYIRARQLLAINNILLTRLTIYAGTVKVKVWVVIRCCHDGGRW
jgi:hypothetical protein